QWVGGESRIDARRIGLSHGLRTCSDHRILGNEIKKLAVSEPLRSLCPVSYLVSRQSTGC
ncbi:MAG: hypothetical protein U1E02_11425, partial [Hydrogenophaga sp.]|nr:hypothetical protein [Hydrogenophaga sp.]